MQRQHYFDNLRAGLIYLVVLGHMFELVTSRILDMAYVLVYLMHMPLFVFVSGYFAKYEPRKLLLGLIPMYFAFQLMYISFLRFGFGHGWLHIQFTTPHWIMWYLFALIFWTMLTPILEFCGKNRLSACVSVIAAFALALLAGFDNSIGYFVSLSRIFYFLPFFVMGYYARMHCSDFPQLFTKWGVRFLFAALSLGTAVLVYLYFERIDLRWFWGAFSYEALSYTGYGVEIRALKYLFTVLLSIFALSFVPRNKLVLSYIGQRTLPVFLLHGFVVLLLREANLMYFVPGGFVILGFVGVLSFVLVLVFSSGLFSYGLWCDILRPKKNLRQEKNK